jgi:adenine-specific DNA methylase
LKTTYPKRLIEVDLPIKRISEHARREKSIRHGHISTLHIWWARRPLAACRAVICAALWPDPADELCPQSFRESASKHVLDFSKKVMSSTKLATEHCSPENFKRWSKLAETKTSSLLPIELRAALLDFIADFANWDNSTVREYLDTSRALTQAAHEALGGAPGTRPLVLDPFAGGGSIPLEALRVGADAFASDLNPVPVLLNKVVLEYIPKYGQGLNDEVRKWGEWIKRQAEKELAEFYPKDVDGATPMAYLWERTVLSEAPTKDKYPIEIPLLRTLWLSKRKDFKRALRWARNKRGDIETKVVEICVNGQPQKVLRPLLEVFLPTDTAQVADGTVKGGSATCPVSGFTTSAARVKEQLKRQRGGAQHSRLYAVYVEREAGREFRVAVDTDFRAFEQAVAAVRHVLSKSPSAFPIERINPIRPYKNTRGLSAVTRIGCETFGDLYNSRQLLSLHVFYKVLGALKQSSGGLEAAFAKALQTTLALAINRGVSQNTSMSRWDASRLTIKGAFSKQALAVVWDFAEANPFSGGSADWDGAINWVQKFIEANLGIRSEGTIVQASATKIPLPSDSASALVTDPPYFAAIPYADLSDFFYVWFRRGLGEIYPELFGGELSEKSDELIVTNAQRGSENQVKDDSFFRSGMAVALKSARDIVQPQGVGVVVYAEGTTAGWEAILGAIIDSDWIVTSSWPIDTEMENRTQAHGSASLQSSIHIVCRPRENSDGSVRGDEIGDWRDVLQELPRRIHEWMPRLAEEGVVGADAIFACLGPALEIFSRYSRVEKASGEGVTLKEYLEQVWAAVAKEALTMIFAGADTTGFEEDARLTAMWLWTLNAGKTDAANSESAEDDDADDESEGGAKKAKTTGFVLEYDAARKIAQGLGAHLEDLGSLVEVAGEQARLLPVAERAAHLFGKNEGKAAPVKKKKAPQLDLFKLLEQADASESSFGETKVERHGETVLDRIHQSMILFAAGRGEALKRFLVEDGIGRDQRFWRLAQALSALYPTHTEEKRWVDGLLARKKGLGF